jgi:hypothetical protein
MPDRSSHQGLPEDWNHGSHAARGAFPAAGASNGYGPGKAGPHRAGTSPETYEVSGARADGHRTDAYPAGAYGAARADPFGDAEPFGPRAAGPFGDAEPFGPRAAGPFGAAPTAAVATEAETTRPEAEPAVTAIGDPSPGEAADARGFLGALFDFGFTSFVTPKVIKVLYMLIVTGTVLSALVFTAVVFKASVMFGFLTLVFGDPLFILIVLAIYRIILEFFVVIFRVAEDIRVLRGRADLS